MNIRGDIIGVGSASTITDNVRHHLVATIDATATTNNILVYGDGAVVATGSANTSGMGTADACIGCYRDVSSHPEYQLSGSIADVAIYGKVLSADSVMAHWLTGR